MKNNVPLRETAILAAGEALVCVLVALGYLLSDALFDTGFTYRVLTGALLGSVVVIVNFLFLSISVNRAVDKYIEIRGTKEMSDEEAEKFNAQHSMAIQNSIKTSYIIRTVSMLATLALAFILDWFAPLATVIPILAYQPILQLGERVRRKFDKAPNPDNFIHYDDSQEESVAEEKESDN